ncbi:hypothetical protein [Microbacterium telephonicum]|uniref:Uncharacterized protein n=1 Tax=Microbacterium telephonicum TaxID=1714841 RepID=A0A498C3B6_9MICO|nr:hypothetical protein [Microbacterium telephonicum]RLK49643.1 hypothetical protein C7474_1803 [Microbacterium telephonicum]
MSDDTRDNATPTGDETGDDLGQSTDRFDRETLAAAASSDEVAADEYAAEHTAPESASATVDADGEPTLGPAAQPSVAEPGEASVQYGVGPFSIREVALLGVWAVAFVVSFFSIYGDARFMQALGVGGTVWTSGISWILTIGAPTVAVGLLVLRRFSPDGIRRVGSLGIDQFASVAFSVATLVWLGILWEEIARAAQGGLWLHSWVIWVEFFLMLAGVLLTVFAPFIAPFDQDFRGRPQVTAHALASPARPVTARPATVPVSRPAADDDADPWAAPAAQTAAAEEPVTTAPAASQAFWALAPVERDVVDESGAPLFTVGPTAWALVIEDRGDTFVVRHEDGRIGYLHDVSGVTRG